LLLFRSEEHIDRWCAERQMAKGAVVPVEQVWRLAGPWYADRLDENWSPRTGETMKRLLGAAGLTGEFWQLP
jgi:hypothetical protein